ncbi:MAG: hypothetical protein KGJ86_00375 [Chloroflexota bacterium]|nr:hypothetical protein [Chloroflexota bacterium]
MKIVLNARCSGSFRVQLDFAGRDVQTFGHAGERTFRRRVQMGFQNPARALNPCHNAGFILGQPLSVHRWADDVAVMERGRIVERGAVKAVLGWPSHPVTQELLSAGPALPASV